MTTTTKSAAAWAVREMAAARKPAATKAVSVAGKLRWRLLGDGSGKTATLGRPHVLAAGVGGKWMAKVTEGGGEIRCPRHESRMHERWGTDYRPR